MNPLVPLLDVASQPLRATDFKLTYQLVQLTYIQLKYTA